MDGPNDQAWHETGDGLVKRCVFGRTLANTCRVALGSDGENIELSKELARRLAEKQRTLEECTYV